MRTLKQIDDDLKKVRTRLLDSVRGTPQREVIMRHLDSLLEERLQAVKAAKSR